MSQSEIVNLKPNLKSGGPPLVGQTQPLIIDVHSYLPYPKDVLSTGNVKAGHALVTVTSLQ